MEVDSPDFYPYTPKWRWRPSKRWKAKFWIQSFNSE